MRVHFRSRDKDGDYTIRSAVRENPMLHANITALRLIELELLPIEVLHCGNRSFRSFRLLWPWHWSDDLYTRTWPVVRGDTPHVQIWTSYVKAFESYRLTDRHTYTRTYIDTGPTNRETGPKLYTAPLRGLSMVNTDYTVSYLVRLKRLSALPTTQIVPSPAPTINPPEGWSTRLVIPWLNRSFSGPTSWNVLETMLMARISPVVVPQ